MSSVPLFGSVARGDATDESDFDLLVALSGPMGLFRFVALKRALEGILGRLVDLVTKHFENDLPDLVPRLESIRDDA